MKTIAFYLPQFHEISENSEWWGDGFTEWVNVKKAKPLFPFHNQPKKPLNENYYNLLNAEVMEEQMKLARKSGIYGFCFYHYWFGGKKLLERPLENLLENPKAKLPFCFAWANESWTKTWHGASGEKEVLIRQQYGSEEEWKIHFNYLLQFFSDNRYMKKNGKPIFLIYRAGYMGTADEMFALWDKMAIENGFRGMYFINMLTGDDRVLKSKYLKASVDFEPGRTKKAQNAVGGWKCELKEQLSNNIGDLGYFNGLFSNYLNYDIINKIMLNTYHGKEQYRGIFVNYDDTPRRGRKGMLTIGSTPKKFEKYLRAGVAKSIAEGNDLYFINAWNEWGEGNFLEPDNKYGYSYLNALQKVMKDVNKTKNK